MLEVISKLTPTFFLSQNLINMAIKESKGALVRPNRDPVKFELQADRLQDFEAEIAKVRILQAAYNHIKDLSPSESISFGLSFGLNW